jgi:hypothetical protein
MFRPAPHSVVGDRGKELGAAASTHGFLVGSSSRGNGRLALIRHRALDCGQRQETLRGQSISHFARQKRDTTDPKANPTSLSTCGLAHGILCFVAFPPCAAFAVWCTDE